MFSMNSLVQYKAYLIVALAAFFVGLGSGFASGWTANGWRIGQKLAEERQDRAEEIAKSAKKAVDDMSNTTKTIHEAAVSYASIQDNLSGQIALFRKEFKNAQKQPLPVGCKPDDSRVRYLGSAIDAANKAATGH